MHRKRHALLSVMLLVGIGLAAAHAQEPATAGAAKAKVSAAAPKTAIAGPVEKDKRLHANGQAWRFDQAAISDPARPRVLVVGDSILNGYLSGVLNSLKGKVYVDAWVNPHFQSANYTKLLAQVLDSGPYDVVHINVCLLYTSPSPRD